MALKSDRIHRGSLIDFFMNETAERGVVVCASTVGSGAAMDQSLQLATVAASPSGQVPLGVLMNDMVNLDLTRQHENWHRDEIQQGGKITIWNDCVVVTNRIYPGHTPAVNTRAFIGHSGLLATSKFVDDDSDGGTTGNSTHVVGMWLSSKDEDGYAKVSVNLPR